MANTLLDETTLGKGTSVTGSSYQPGPIFSLAFQGKATGDANCTADVRIHLRSSIDEADWDTVDVKNFDIPVSGDAGNKVVKSTTLDPDYKYVRPVAENLDATYSASNVIVKIQGKQQDVT